MRTTIVPAQITSVEDRVVGNLSLVQLVLLIGPLFGGGVLYMILPPLFRFDTYKVMLMSLLLIACASLAIRVKGMIMMVWLGVIIRYVLRPRYSVFDKNDSIFRAIPKIPEITEVVATAEKTTPDSTRLQPSELMRAETVVTDPRVQLLFAPSKKGGVRVTVTESKA
jgi:hypothetical protein